MVVNTSYIICGTQRSGSSLLSEGLSSTNIAGKPEEYFWLRHEKKWSRRWHVTHFSDYLDQVIEHSTTANNVLGIKLMMGENYFWRLIKKIQSLPTYSSPNKPPNDVLAQVFPNLHYIWITRQNKVRQAVSYWKAVQTGIWYNTPQTHHKKQKTAHYHFERIDKLLQEIVMQEVAWQEYFETYNIRPLVIIYEDFIQSYETTIQKVLTHLNISLPSNHVITPPPIQKQADKQSEIWVQKFRADKQESWKNKMW